MNKWINEFKFGTIEEGRNRGTLAIQIDFNDIDPTKEDVVGLIKRIEDYPKGLYRNIAITGKYPDNPQGFITFTRILQEHGYLIQATIDGNVYYPWLNYISWIVVKLNEPIWSGLAVHEIRLPFKENLIEPSESPKLVPVRYIVLDKESNRKGAFKFLKNSKKEWGILLKSKGVFE